MKLLGHDIVTTAELKDFEQEVINSLRARIVAAESKLDSVKPLKVIGALLAVVVLVETVCLFVR